MTQNESKTTLAVMRSVANNDNLPLYVLLGVLIIWVWLWCRRSWANESGSSQQEDPAKTDNPEQPTTSGSLQTQDIPDHREKTGQNTNRPGLLDQKTSKFSASSSVNMMESALPEETIDLQINSDFTKIIDAIADGQSIFITGNAGTGKSTLLRYIAGTTNKQIAIVAPTAVAALNAGGQTIHSFFEFPHRVLKINEIKRSKKSGKFRSIDMLLIDEVSMIRADLMDAIDKSLRVNRLASEPFGGVQIICFGDMAQLPPVIDSSDLKKYFDDTYGSPFFFSAKVFRRFKLNVIELTKNYRQSDAEFLLLLAEIRNGDKSGRAVQRLNRLVATRFEPSAGDSAIVLTPTRARAAEINDSCIQQLPGMAACFEATITGRFPSKSAPADHDIFLKRGAKVIMVKNDPQKRWINGSVGTIVELDEKSRAVKVKIGERTWDVCPVTWEHINYSYCENERRLTWKVVGTFTQIPVSVGYAITIHKSQGKTIDRICLDTSAGGAFDHGQIYVALSRCRKLNGVKLTYPLYAGDIILDPRAFGYASRFASQ